MRMNQGPMRGIQPVGNVSGGSGMVANYNVGSRVESNNRPREFDRQGRAFQGSSRGKQSNRQMVERNVRSKERSTYDHRGRDDSGARDCDLEEVMFDLENQRSRANVVRGVSVNKPGRVSKVPKRASTADARSSVNMAIMQGQLDAMSCKLDKFLGSVADKGASKLAIHDDKGASNLATHAEDVEHSDMLSDQGDGAEMDADVSVSTEIGGLLCVLCFWCYCDWFPRCFCNVVIVFYVRMCVYRCCRIAV